MTRSTLASGARFRQRKLSTRQTLQVFREDQVEDLDDEAQRNVPKVETGVEKGEEIEHHLQAAISASQAAAVGGKVAQIYIPTPDTIQSSIQYDRLYPIIFSQPATYIRFSSTVEDCIGCSYNMIEEDDVFLKPMNERRNASTQCTEEQFEDVMSFFEDTAQAKQPYAAVDNSPVITWREMEIALEENYMDDIKPLAREMYEHWKARRLKTGNRSLLQGLKFETGAETDDGDPYVCFRRREVRQVRKTRGRDAQSAEKLKKLRKELEEARQLIALLRQREAVKKEQLLQDRQLFEQRTNLRAVKRNLPDQFKEGDDELLINQKPQKRKPLEIATSQRTQATQLRLPSRPDGRSAESDLVPLDVIMEGKENEIAREINMKISQHQKWNDGYVDMTMAPLTPPLEENIRSTFRPAVAEYLPTPPASVSSEHSGDAIADMGSPSRRKDDSVAVRYASPASDEPNRTQPSFRRRRGRGGRLMIDRRGMHLQSRDGLDPKVVERFRFDRDDDDEEETPIYPVDSYDIASMRYRAAVIVNTQSQAQAQLQAARRAQQIEASAANSQAAMSGTGSSVGPKSMSSE